MEEVHHKLPFIVWGLVWGTIRGHGVNEGDVFDSFGVEGEGSLCRQEGIVLNKIQPSHFSSVF